MINSFFKPFSILKTCISSINSFLAFTFACKWAKTNIQFLSDIFRSRCIDFIDITNGYCRKWDIPNRIIVRFDSGDGWRCLKSIPNQTHQDDGKHRSHYNGTCPNDQTQQFVQSFVSEKFEKKILSIQQNLNHISIKSTGYNSIPILECLQQCVWCHAMLNHDKSPLSFAPMPAHSNCHEHLANSLVYAMWCWIFSAIFSSPALPPPLELLSMSTCMTFINMN